MYFVLYVEYIQLYSPIGHLNLLNNIIPKLRKQHLQTTIASLMLVWTHARQGLD